MEPVSVFFGFVVGMIAGIHLGYERWLKYLHERQRREVILTSEQAFVLFTTKESLSEYEIVAMQRKEV